jgi:hypothetical protein
MISNLYALLHDTPNGSKRQRDLSGQLLLRALRAGISIHYGELNFVALNSAPQAIAFVFEGDPPCERTPDGTAVRVPRKGPGTALNVRIKVA